LKSESSNNSSAFRIDPEYHEKSYALKTENTNKLLRRIFAAFPQISKDPTEIYRLNHYKKIYFEDLIVEGIFSRMSNRFNLQYYKDPTQISQNEKNSHYEINDIHFNKFKRLFGKFKTIVSKFFKFINDMVIFNNDNRDTSIQMFKVSPLSHFRNSKGKK
jgi:hypothetical protein